MYSVPRSGIATLHIRVWFKAETALQRPNTHCSYIKLRDQRQLHFISSTARKAEHEWRRWGVPSQQVHPEKVSTTFYSALPSWCVSDPHLLRSASRGMPLVLPLAGICAIVPLVQRI